jgi:VanZ family protein
MALRDSPSSLARYLFWAYALLVIYASLHPFYGWTDTGAPAFAYLSARLPRYITAFDISANILAYIPLGLLGVLALYPQLRGIRAAWASLLAALTISVSVEALQTFLPSRIPSNLDVASNAAGALIGALAGAALTQRVLRDDGLQALRYRLFHPGGRTDLGLVLLGLWLLSQLSPETLLFGNGDLRELFQTPGGEHHQAEVFIRAEAAVAGANTLAVCLFLSILVRYGQPLRPLMFAVLAFALLVRSFAYALLFGAEDFLLWVTPGAMYGVAAGAAMAAIAAGFSTPVRTALAGLALMAATAIVNLAPENPYLAMFLAEWRQGHFLNFTGLTRVVSALWPFAALAWLLALAGNRDRSRSD